MTTLNWPNRITLLRIVLTAPFVVCLLQLQDPQWGTTARRTALGIFVIMAATDGLDGYLARRLKAESPLGRFLDPLADKVLIVAAVVLLARRDTGIPGALVPSAAVVAALGKDLCVLVGFCILYFITSRVCISPRRAGKLCTTAQLAMIVAILLRPDLPGAMQWLPPVCWWVATAMAVIATVDYYRFGQRFVATAMQTRVAS